MAFTNSSLVDYTKISPNKTSPRRHTIDTITIHCVVGQCSIEALGAHFASPSLGASSNYGIGYDGRIGMYVEEKDCSWCSSNTANDDRAITIEVASDATHPYAVKDAALKSLIELVADICKRNGIKKLVWSENKSDRVNHVNGCNMTVHRDYANKSCPGQYLYDRHPYIAEEVNKRLGASSGATSSAPTTSTPTPAPTPSVSTSRIDTVKEVQSWANTNYKSGLVVDGIYGANTKRALVKILQTEINQTYGARLVIDGIWGKNTMSACPTLTKGSRNDVVKVLQALLVCNGYANAYVDGDYGSGTYESVKGYQKKKWLVVDGIAGKNTFAKLCS